GRGGGSIEDLWAFNDERVARAIYDSEIPVISAVGHEPDVTISDFVAGRRRHPGIEARLCDGVRLVVYGRVDVYAARGNCQFVVQAAKIAGEGELLQKYLELKAKLEREGLFDSSRKRPLPAVPRRIGIVTSESGAVIHDIFRVLSRRFPALEARLYPATVQGAGAAQSVIAGVDHFNSSGDWRADVLIIARGGGSFEDLFCFNDEALVRAVAGSAIPTISAVGHESDTTLCDFAADRRAGTPSMAAEIAVPRLADLKAELSRIAGVLLTSLRARYELHSQRVDGLADALTPALKMKVERYGAEVERLSAAMQPALALRAQRYGAEVERLSSALVTSLGAGVAAASSALSELAAKLKLLSPYGVLERGYSLTTDAAGAVVRSACDVKPGDILVTRLASGSVESVAR
ncbi:MAG: exodeoxyribonuclease VII large subunit, partial [Kiritimatiellae bacterium]|nr:exodeoxyribonuclease VII large subunit [Kiritimatiellia bacterium]